MTPFDAARADAEAKSTAPFDLQTVAASIDRASRIDLAFTTPLATDFDEVAIQTYAFARVLLGERRFDRWVGNLTATEPARGLLGRWKKPVGTPVAELPALVDELVARVSALLPATPWSASRSARLPVKRRPSGSARRADITTGETAHLPLFEAATDGGSFASERFTRHAETFAYVMTVGDAPALASKIDAALKSAGATLGWAAGDRFAYVDLALGDERAATEILRPLVSAPAWLLFLDDDRHGATITLAGADAPP